MTAMPAASKHTHLYSDVAAAQELAATMGALVEEHGLRNVVAALTDVLGHQVSHDPALTLSESRMFHRIWEALVEARRKAFPAWRYR